jgi:hypothetical protein
MSLTFHYDLVLKRNDTRKIVLPDLKSSCLLLRSFEIKSDHKAFDIKIIGKDTIVSYGEAVFYQTNVFDLSGKLSQIIDADELQVIIKNLCTPKDSNTVTIVLTFNYSKMDDGSVIFNNIYTNLNTEGLSNIVSDLSKAGKHLTKFIWTSPNKLSSIELNPQFNTEPQWLKPIKELVNNNNQIIMDLMNTDKYDPDLVNQLKYYTLSIPENIEKLGVIVYGYHH